MQLFQWFCLIYSRLLLFSVVVFYGFPAFEGFVNGGMVKKKSPEGLFSFLAGYV